MKRVQFPPWDAHTLSVYLSDSVFSLHPPFVPNVSGSNNHIDLVFRDKYTLDVRARLWCSFCGIHFLL